MGGPTWFPRALPAQKENKQQPGSLGQGRAWRPPRPEGGGPRAAGPGAGSPRVGPVAGAGSGRRDAVPYLQAERRWRRRRLWRRRLGPSLPPAARRPRSRPEARPGPATGGRACGAGPSGLRCELRVPTRLARPPARDREPASGSDGPPGAKAGLWLSMQGGICESFLTAQHIESLSTYLLSAYYVPGTDYCLPSPLEFKSPESGGLACLVLCCVPSPRDWPGTWTGN
nr:translation initiation factor IF-2-like [Equus asinus]